VLHTTIAMEDRAVTGAANAVSIIGVDTFAEQSSELQRLADERALDEVLAESFPASDPPSWTLGIARPRPRNGVELHSNQAERIADTAARAVASEFGLSPPSSGHRTFGKGLLSLAGATGIALLVPVAILLVGLPVVLVVRGVLEGIGWLFGVALP
jgi:hypothetical protein